MKKILLVDDEFLVRVGIKSIINWEENGYTIIGEASNGSDAMDKIRLNTPDIVITDIVMDTMNGLELIKKLRKEYPQIKCIVLSCYNDFDNVKEAMKLGASDYIFKLTIKPDELIKTLNDLTDHLQDSSDRSEMQKKESIVHRNIHAIKGRIIRTAIDKSYLSVKSLQAEMDEVKIKLDTEREYILMCISIDNFKMFSKNSFIKEKELLKFSMQNIADEVFQKFSSAEVFDYEGGYLIATVNVEPDIDFHSFEVALMGAFDQLKEYIKRYLGIDVSAGFSQLHFGILECNLAFKEAMEALELRFADGRVSCYSYSQLEKVLDKEPELPNTLQVHLFSELVDHLDETRMIKFINEYIDWLKDSKGFKTEKIRRLLLELLYSFSKVANSRGMDIDIFVDEFELTPFQVISQYESVEAIRTWFNRFVANFVKECAQKQDTRCREEIINIKNFIRKNLDKDINISMAANFINMSESYFSHFFKKETGTSFVDYVNNTRIQRGKELILQTDLKIYEISLMVGFDNANYFSLMFKKITGKSPNFYRRSLENKESSE